jgi:hypothetical protein
MPGSHKIKAKLALQWMQDLSMSSVSSPRKIYSGNQNLDSRFILEYGRLA